QRGVHHRLAGAGAALRLRVEREDRIVAGTGPAVGDEMAAGVDGGLAQGADRGGGCARRGEAITGPASAASGASAARPPAGPPATRVADSGASARAAPAGRRWPRSWRGRRSPARRGRWARAGAAAP